MLYEMIFYMKKINNYNFLILSILASFLILLNSCSSRGKIWDPADAREFPAEPEKRVLSTTKLSRASQTKAKMLYF